MFVDAEKSKQVEKAILDAEMEIKLLIRDNVLKNGITEMKQKIEGIIDKHLKNLPKEIENIEYYKNVLLTNAIIWQRQFWSAVSNLKALTVQLIKYKNLAEKIPMIKNADKMTPIELYQTMVKVGERFRTLGVTSAIDYPNRLRKEIRKLGGTSADTIQIGERKTRLIAKIELDLRYEYQLKMIQEKKESGHDLYWISTHSSCSKRCEPWQGKIVSVSLPAINEKHETGLVVDGYKVYSLDSITSQLDKYGYKNNVIVGFNCRHTLIKYNKGDNPPPIYYKDEIKHDRKVNDKLRRYENTIRNLKKQAVVSIDKQERRLLKQRAKELTNEYIKFAQENQVAYYLWRLAL